MKNYQPSEGTKARIALDAIREAGQMTPIQIASILDTSPKNVAAILYACMDHQLLVKVGRGNGTYYRPATEADLLAKVAPDAAAGAPADPEGAADDLTISIWSDGDVMVEGATVHTDDGNKVVFTQRQITHLVRMVARPTVQVAA
jgi:hypothetical protein